jgi:hypothetical protein
LKIKLNYEGTIIEDDFSTVSASLGFVHTKEWELINEIRKSTMYLLVKITPNTEAIIYNTVVDGFETEIDQENKIISASIENFNPDEADISDLVSSFNSTVETIVRDGKLYLIVTAEDKVTSNEYLFVNTYEPQEEEETEVEEPEETDPEGKPETGDHSYMIMLLLASSFSIGILNKYKKK